MALSAALSAAALQSLGWLHAPAAQHGDPGALGRWVWPVVAALAAHVLAGPKQRRPIYRKVPGALYVYAGITVDRGGGCRGGLITGSTGSGKTLCCILPRLHSICVNQPGIERPGWRASPEFRALSAERARQARLHRERAEPMEGDSAAALQRLVEACRACRYLEPPWGGFVCGEKGNEWQTLEALLSHHGRREDLCLLRTRPAGASPEWRPPARLNLLSLASVPADTYAQMLVDTAAAVEEPTGRDEFFVTQARDKIAWGLRLARAVLLAAERDGLAASAPAIPVILDLLSVQESYQRFVSAAAAAHPSLATCAAFAEARYQLEQNYWSQPPEQLGGVRSTVYNYLAAYCDPEIAEVFCADSTLALADVEQGKVFCLAIPQRLALQRRYIATLLKTLVYRIVLERFDRDAAGNAEARRNVILVEQDEWQRHAVRADCDADIVREAGGAVYAATQSQNAVWLRLGGRERAAPVIANLRNRWICQAATDDCAGESCALLGERMTRERSFSRGDAGRSSSVALRQAPLIPKRELRGLAPFHVIFAPAQGPWLYRRAIAMPVTPDGQIPPWWFGDWNPLHWAADLVRRSPRPAAPERVPPWRAAAPLRAQIRWLAGLDGTFILLEGVRRSALAGTRADS